MRLTPPVRFLAMVLVAWTAGRVAVGALNAPYPIAADRVRASEPANAVLARPDGGSGYRALYRLDHDEAPWPFRRSSRDERALPAATVARASRQHPTIRNAAAPIMAAMTDRTVMAGMPSTHRAMIQTSLGDARLPVAVPSDVRVRPWSIAGWALIRPGGARALLADAGQLGGSQAGLRAAYRIAEPLGAVVALAARLSRPLDGPNGAEAALGLAVRPAARVPIEITVERRIALERGARDAWSLGLAGGVDHVPLPLALELDAYAQAGVVGARSRDLYVDAAVTVQREAARLGRATLHVGGGAWGAAQPGLSRLDVGPRVTLRLPVDPVALRLSVDWRERVAGDAEPGSGPALTLAADF